MNQCGPTSGLTDGPTFGPICGATSTAASSTSVLLVPTSQPTKPATGALALTLFLGTVITIHDF
jgi:hypothetical protein